MEVLFYTDSTGNPYNINSIELFNGQPYAIYKEGTSSPGTLCFVNNDYVISAVPKKAVLSVFETNRCGRQCLKVITPGVVKVLCTSNDGSYIAAGIGERILVWSAISGELLSILSKHYQDVTKLCFSSNGTILVSSGLDGLISVWKTGDIIDTVTSNPKEPFLCWSSHVLPVTQLCCSFIGGSNSRVYSSSLDRTIKIHDIGLESIILTLVFPKSISSFCIDSAEMMLIAGGTDGALFKVDLISLAKSSSGSSTSSISIEGEGDKNRTINSFFKGHEQSVTCLVFNIDATRFVSGSADKMIKVWDVFSNQVIRAIEGKGTITNLHLTLSSPSYTTTDHKPKYPFPKLARAPMDLQTDENQLRIVRLDQQFHCPQPKRSRLEDVIEDCRTKKITDNAVENIEKLKNDVENLKDINNKLFEFASSNVLSS